jgi:hypothetical protein
LEEYRPPKLIGKKAPLNCLVLPYQHHTAWKAAQRYNMSFGEYVGALIDRAKGRPNKLDGMQQGAWAIEESQDAKMRHVTKTTRSRFLKTNPRRAAGPVIVSEQSQGTSS